jgi:hypothetical protein
VYELKKVFDSDVFDYVDYYCELMSSYVEDESASYDDVSLKTREFDES